MPECHRRHGDARGYGASEGKGGARGGPGRLGCSRWRTLIEDTGEMREWDEL